MEIVSAAEESASFCYRLITPWANYAWMYNVLMAAPAVLLFFFLVANARASVRKLAQSQSHIMATYYCFLWVICLLNICWCLVEVGQTGAGERATTWNVVALVTRSGMLLLEISVIVFLSQGYLVSGWDALLRTLLFSGLFAAADVIIKAIYIFGIGVPLFIFKDDSGDWRKWGFWLVHSAFFSGLYLLILILPHTKWKERLPARPSFYRYVFLLFLLNFMTAFGSSLLGFKATFGYCVYGVTSFCYYAIYPPLLYVTFLSDFFQEEHMQAEDVYYSEMKDAGYFDTEWD